MFRKISFVIICLLFLATIFYAYFYYKQMKQPVTDPVKAIPNSAAFFIESKNLLETYTGLSQSNMMWEQLMHIPSFDKINRGLQFLDSLYRENENVARIMTDRSLFTSAHPANDSALDFLMLFNLPPDIEPAIMHSTIQEVAAKTSTTDYEGVKIHTVSGKEQENFYYAIDKNIFAGSYSPVLIKDAIHQLNDELSLKAAPGFTQVRETAGASVSNNVYINHQLFPELLALLLEPEAKETIEPLKEWATWTELDLKIKPNALLLNGFTWSPDTAGDYLNLFRDQRPGESQLASIAPASTAIFLAFHFSDYTKYRQRWLEYLKAKSIQQKTEEQLQAINDSCNCNIRGFFTGWAIKEMALVITEPKAATQEESYFAVFNTPDIRVPAGSLERLIDSLAANGSADTIPYEYKGFEVRNIPVPPVLPVLYGGLFNKMISNYYTVINDFIIFGNSLQEMQHFINEYFAENTLIKNKHFFSYAENLSAEHNIFLFANISRSYGWLQGFLNQDYLPGFETRDTLFKKFQAVSWQISTDRNNLYYNNLYLKYNPITKEESNSLWETKLDTTLNMKPQLVINHYSQAKEIFVQDEKNTVYLISNTGQILWKKKLEAPVMGEVHQVDIFKNNKLQMLFNTASNIYILDRNGNDVEGFPVQLPSPATAPLSLFDYENDKDYRILIPCGDKQVYNYDIKGKKVKGWQFSKAAAVINQPLKHFLLNKKDYIVTIDSTGNIYVLDRRGEERLKITQKLPLSHNNSFYIETGKTINQSFITGTDSTGTIRKVYFNNKAETIVQEGFSPNHYFEYQDINYDKNREYIFADNNRLVVYAPDQKISYEYIFEDTITTPPLYFEFPGSAEIGILLKRTGKIYLLGAEGNVREKFPLNGYSLFSIGDINRDGVFNLITGSDNGRVYTYNLE